MVAPKGFNFVYLYYLLWNVLIISPFIFADNANLYNLNKEICLKRMWKG